MSSSTTDGNEITATAGESSMLGLDTPSESLPHGSDDSNTNRMTISEKEDIRNTNDEEVEPRIMEPDNKGHGTDLWEEKGLLLSFHRSYVTPYFWANVVYCVYAAIIVTIDVNESTWDLGYLNNMYIGANCVHLFNALLYMVVWVHEGYRGKKLLILFIPEILNCCEASLYISSSTYYNKEGYSGFENVTLSNGTLDIINGSYQTVYVEDPVTYDVQNIEMTASLVAMTAAFGWCITWFITYRRIPGRGFTFDDPDVWALITLLIGDAMYIVYNSQIINDRATYGTNMLYAQADYVFLVNSWLYLACSLRDVGWFYMLPKAGRMNFDKKYKKIDKPKKG